METAKVDIRKLQMLNDRIAQTIDALNQVRLSVHGVAQSAANHSGAQPMPAQAPWNPFPSAFGVTHSPYGQNPYTPAAFAQTPYAGSPFAQSPYGQSQYGQAPYGQPPFGAPGFAQPYGQGPFGNGIGHTSGTPIDALLSAGIDPTLTQRMAQTFPFVQWGYSPYGSPLF